MNSTIVLAMGLVLFLSIAEAADGESTVTRSLGGSMMTKLGHGMYLNRESSLRREWVVVNDSTLPASLVGGTGVRPVYDAGSYSGKFLYSAKATVHVREAIAAFEVRFLIFDVWGDQVRVLSAAVVADISEDERYEGDWKWNLFSENEASELFASVAYVARVRTQDGRVLRGNVDAVLEEARRFSKEIAEGDLEPESEGKD